MGLASTLRDQQSPVFLTTNFALTYYTVESDIASNGIDAYIIAINTDGIGVHASVACGQLSPAKILDSFNEAAFDWAGQKHTAMVLPGMAAKFSGELEELFPKTKIMVGPEDSGRIIGLDEGFLATEVNGADVPPDVHIRFFISVLL